jgi:hypothetical protein
MVLADPEMS